MILNGGRKVSQLFEDVAAVLKKQRNMFRGQEEIGFP